MPTRPSWKLIVKDLGTDEEILHARFGGELESANVTVDEVNATVIVGIDIEHRGENKGR